MRFSIFVAFAAGVAAAVPVPEQIILNPQNDANRSASGVSKDHESVNKAPSAVVYAIRNPEDGSVTNWECREKRVLLEQIFSFKSILSFWLLCGILFLIFEIMIKFEAEALANEIELARLEEDLMYDYEIL